VYFVIYIPLIRKVGSLGYRHNPYAVFFADQYTPLILFHLDKNLEVKAAEGLLSYKKLVKKIPQSLLKVALSSIVITACGDPSKSARYRKIAEKYGKVVSVPEHLVAWNFPHQIHARKEVTHAHKILKTYLLMKRDLELLLKYERISVLVGKPKKKVMFLFKASINDTKPKLLSTAHFHLPSRKTLKTRIWAQGVVITIWPIVLENRIMFKLTGKENKLRKARKASSMYLTYLRNIYRVVGCQSQAKLT